MTKREIIASVQTDLFALQDLKYRDFQSSLIPTINKELVIGVRTPALRKYVKEFKKCSEAEIFMEVLPHKYYEENNLHGFLINEMKDYDACITALDQFLPYVDNWASCDLLSPKILKKHLKELLPKIEGWIHTERTYTIRFGIEMLMSFYLDDAFDIAYPELVAGVKSEEYYVNMMIAWYFATALVKQYDTILPFIKEQRLEKWTHNKTIQKAVESYRITDEQKTYLRSLKV